MKNIYLVIIGNVYSYPESFQAFSTLEKAKTYIENHKNDKDEYGDIVDDWCITTITFDLK